LGASFLLIVFGSKAILKPILKLEYLIRAMSRQEENLPAISKSGPKELIVLENQLHILAGRLVQLESLRHALLRHASHELKTPLASIKEGCSLLTEQVVGPLNAEQEEVLSLLNSSTDRLNLLIVQLLDYNLLLQQAKPVLSKINTQRFFEEFVTENSLAIKQHDNQIEMKIELSSIFADHTLFRRIVDNLVSNAIAHGSKGRPINIRLYQRDNMQILDFANCGQKIPVEHRNILFQPFSRGEGVRNDRVTGSGLGLSIVADCARMMFGKAEMVDVEYAEVCIRVQIPSKEAII
jgi:two-component system sensor histidine kinase GlrK